MQLTSAIRYFARKIKLEGGREGMQFLTLIKKIQQSEQQLGNQTECNICYQMSECHAINRTSESEECYFHPYLGTTCP